MRIEDFNISHIDEARSIAAENYERERKVVPELPRIEVLPGLEHFAENNLGAVAFEGNHMIGFLGAYSPFEDAFGTTGVRGTFSPIHAHGVLHDFTGSERERIYSRLYQSAADKWVKAGILSHAIALYTHDKEAINSFFYNGFGIRCIDAIRSLENIPENMVNSELSQLSPVYREVSRNEWGLLIEQHNDLISHLGNSPAFLKYYTIDIDELYRRTTEGTRYFAVKIGADYVAYVKIDRTGENFATDVEGMMNICGAYCNPKYRGIGIYHNLLLYLMSSLKEEGYTRLGVDFESFNPNARGFWLKHFKAYTNSVVRRIDDRQIL